MLSTARIAAPAYALHERCLARLITSSRAGVASRLLLTAEAGVGHTSGNEVPRLHTPPHFDDRTKAGPESACTTVGRDQASSTKQGCP